MSVQDNFELDAGGTFIREFAYVNDEGVAIDITGYKARAQVRTSTYTRLLFESEPSIDAETFVITMHWTPEQTSLMRDRKYQYGLEIYNDTTGDVAVLTHGVITVNQEIVK